MQAQALAVRAHCSWCTTATIWCRSILEETRSQRIETAAAVREGGEGDTGCYGQDASNDCKTQGWCSHACELLRLDWNEVSQVDKLTMTRTAIKKSYIRKRQVLHMYRKGHSCSLGRQVLQCSPQWAVVGAGAGPCKAHNNVRKCRYRSQKRTLQGQQALWAKADQIGVLRAPWQKGVNEDWTFSLSLVSTPTVPLLGCMQRGSCNEAFHSEGLPSLQRLCADALQQV
eukprot:91542-Pelagomonas_calceolata.AAC.1